MIRNFSFSKVVVVSAVALTLATGVARLVARGACRSYRILRWLRRRLLAPPVAILLRLLVLRRGSIRRLLEILIDHQGRKGQKCKENQAAKIAAAGAPPPEPCDSRLGLRISGKV